MTPKTTADLDAKVATKPRDPNAWNDKGAIEQDARAPEIAANETTATASAEPHAPNPIKKPE